MKMIHLTMVLAKKVSISSDPANVLLSYPNACLSNVCSMNMRSFLTAPKTQFPIKLKERLLHSFSCYGTDAVLFIPESVYCCRFLPGLPLLFRHHSVYCLKYSLCCYLSRLRYLLRYLQQHPLWIPLSQAV